MIGVFKTRLYYCFQLFYFVSFYQLLLRPEIAEYYVFRNQSKSIWRSSTTKNIYIFRKLASAEWYYSKNLKTEYQNALVCIHTRFWFSFFLQVNYFLILPRNTKKLKETEIRNIYHFIPMFDILICPYLHWPRIYFTKFIIRIVTLKLLISLKNK